MKLFVKTFLIFLYPFFAQSQSIERQVVSSTGFFVLNTNGSLSFTVGEPIIVLGTDGSRIITQGFQQPNITTSITIEKECRFDFFPNPTRQILSINTSVQDNAFEVFDVLGRSYGFFKNVNGEMDVSDLTAGIYFIKVDCINFKGFFQKFIKV